MLNQFLHLSEDNSASIYAEFNPKKLMIIFAAYTATYHDSVLYIGEDHRGSCVHDLGRPLKRFLLTWFDVNHCLRVVIEIDLFSPTSAKTSARCQLVGAGRNIFIVLQTWSFFISFRYSSLHPHDYNETLQHKVNFNCILYMPMVLCRSIIANFRMLNQDSRSLVVSDRVL